MSSYDVIIIGTGAGGGTLARHLAPSGKRVLLLERGGWLPREPQNWQAADVFVDNRYISPDTWYDAHDKPFQPQVHYFVGGATKLYGAALYRLRAEDFGELRHEDGISPAWPIGYDEMEPYYTLAEQMYEVHGARGEDPTEPPASAPYPHPPVSHEPRIQQLADDLAAAGYQPFHAPCGVMLDEADPPYSTCVRCGTCDGFPCLVHAKSDAEVLGVRPALEAGNVTLLIGARALRLETDASGHTVTGVVVEQDGRRETMTADIVVVSCGAANSAALLLASASEAHPDGLANGSGQVGRNYMFHNSQAVLALSKEPNPTVFQKTLGVNDYYFATKDINYPLGNIQMVGKSQAQMYRGEKPLETRLAPEWTLDRVAAHAVDFWLSTEDLPRPDNRVTLREDGSIRLAYTPSNEMPKKRLLHELKGMLGHIGMHHDHLLPRRAYLKNEIPVAGCAHQAGTCRFGRDPKTSVLDTDCRAHEVDNLYVVDTSFFPSIGAVNPALTAMANAIRVGDHLLDRLGAGAAHGAGMDTWAQSHAG
jgi:choline dehydrogenase-like flavoprotein